MQSRISVLAVSVFIIVMSANVSSVFPLPYTESNGFLDNPFPGEVTQESFSLPLDAGSLAVVCPDGEGTVSQIESLLLERTGNRYDCYTASDLPGDILVSDHLIVIGNIMNNHCALELYKRRFAFADAYFPGEGGYIIHPARSLWNPKRSVIVVGISSDADIVPALNRLCDEIGGGAGSLGAIHAIETAMPFPAPPESVDATFDNVRENLHTAMAPYWSIANWGLLYFLTGDKKWAEHCRDGFRLCYERAEKTGSWIPEGWTNVYFNLWKMVYAWELIGDDPFFTPEDRRIIEEVLWGYTTFCRWMPNLDPENAPMNELRQNHTTFLALSLYYAHRYYTEKYGIEGLENMMTKVHRAFDDGQMHSYRPNDDAGNYLYLAPMHLLTYGLAENKLTYLDSGRMRTMVDLVAMTIDNRGDPVSFGDVGGYIHREAGATRGRELSFFGLGSWYYNDPEYKWLYDWGAKGKVISLSTMEEQKDGENPIQMHFGADRVFSVEDMYTGVYAVDMETRYPERYTGVFAVTPDDTALRWSARRTENASHLPVMGVRYLDKMSFRNDFDPGSEYLLLDGLSTMSHGHHDGNTISRLTWKDRVWLFDLDYIKLTPRYHNGVSVTRDGVQCDPPPLTELRTGVDFADWGMSRTISPDYNGCDWTRSIVWRKGNWFVVLDRLDARDGGAYRFEAIWRTRGDVVLDNGTLTVRQGDAAFHIISADTAERSLRTEPDGTRSNWNYPYGDGEMTIETAVKRRTLNPGESWDFVNLLHVTDETADNAGPDLRRIDNDTWFVSGAAGEAVIGYGGHQLERDRLELSCGLFIVDESMVIASELERFICGPVSLTVDFPVSFMMDVKSGRGEIVVPEGVNVTLNVSGVTVDGAGNGELTLGPGRYTVRGFDTVPASGTFVDTMGRRAWRVLPDNDIDMTADFALTPESMYNLPETITATTSGKNDMLAGCADGVVYRCVQGLAVPVCTMPSGGSVVCLAYYDITGDGRPEVIAGDNNAHVYAFADDGTLLWSYTLKKYYGVSADAVDITIANVDGRILVLVANRGWRLHAFRPDGSLVWEAFTYYHPQTQVRYLDDGPGRRLVAVGTEYHTPLNVVDPSNGETIWHVWEEMGSEYLVTTDYHGIHLTAMCFVDADDDGDRDIVFGTKSRTLCALDAATGETIWQRMAGGEITVLEVLPEENRIFAATQAGDVMLLTAGGEVVTGRDVGEGLTSGALLPVNGGFEFALATDRGNIIVLDENLMVRGACRISSGPVMALHVCDCGDKLFILSAAGARAVHSVSYTPLSLRKSRHY